MNRFLRPISLIAWTSALAAIPIVAAIAAPPVSPDFEGKVAPLLAKRCLECHNRSSAQGGLDLTVRESALKGGKRGPALSVEKPLEGWIWKRVAAGQMPPGHPLPETEKALLKQWLTSGAPWTGAIDPLRYTSERRAGYDWWSLQPVRRPQIPKLRNPKYVIANPIDAFIGVRLEQAGLKPSPTADRTTLIRRLSFDLLGLPPSPEEVDAFVNDRRSDAYERLVDRLLASPHYGERWARHWLDVVRFGESQGFERNKLRPNAWKYRDWVVEALNSDMRYDEFVRLQIAGDVLRPDDPMAVLGTGFLVVGPYDLTAYTATSKMMQMAAREEEMEGLVGSVAQTFLGLTANCARCHDHKFDPIAQKDYYAFAAALGGTYHGAERDSLSAAGKAASEKTRAELSAEIDALKSRLSALPQADLVHREQLSAEIGRVESRIRLLSGGPSHVVVPQQPGEFRLFARGDFRQPKEAVAPGGLPSLAGVPADWGLKGNAPEAERRKAVAAWLADPRNPLTARVIVNRVWAHHFGVGLVDTPNDFGFNGGKPSHPELLDFLASLFTTETRSHGEGGEGLGWSLKRLHRLILVSKTYQQSSVVSAADGGGIESKSKSKSKSKSESESKSKSKSKSKNEADPGNKLFWRQNSARLEAEALRDAVLAVSGQLDKRIGGPGFQDWTSKTEGENVHFTVNEAPVGPEFNRRTLYRTVVRAGTSPFLDVLDCPDPSVSAPRRTTTTTPLQALTLLNNGFMEHSASKWAERLEREAPADRRAQVALAYRQAFARRASEEELRTEAAFAEKYGLAQLCLVLFNANEFLYVD